MKKILIGLLSLAFIVSLSHVCIVEAATLDGLSIGADIRVRGVVLANKDLNDNAPDNTTFVRHRTRLWLKTDLEDGVSAYIRLTAEPRWGHGCDSLPGSFNDVLIDNSYMVVNDIFGSPFALKIGRQDIMLGDGFLVMDGTFCDGSRTGYFDAIRFTGVFGNNTLDILMAKTEEGVQSEDADDNDLYGVYLTNKSMENHQIEAYLLHKIARDETISIGANTFTGLDLKPMVIGVRSTGKIVENLTYTAEVAKQFGSIETNVAGEADVDYDGLGGHASLTYSMPEASSLKITGGVTYLSGVDDSDDYTGWDGFYGEYARYGMLMAYLRDADNDPGYYNNMMIAELRASVKPMPKVTTKAVLLFVTAIEDELSQVAGEKDRGTCPQLTVNYEFSETLTGQLHGEMFMPGDYYGIDMDDATYVRFQMTKKFN